MKLLHPTPRLLTAGLLLALTTTTHAADFYRQTDAGNNSTGNNWNNVNNYFDQTSGGGNPPTQMAGNDFFSNGFFVRASPGSFAGDTTFEGDSFTLNGGGMGVRVGNNGTANIANLITDGATISTGSEDATLAVDTFTSNGLTTFSANTNSGTGLFINIDTLTGSGGFEFQSTSASAGNGRYVELTILNASGFTGNLTWIDDPGDDAVWLQFGNDAVLLGSTLIAEGNNHINLDQDITLGGLMLDGDTLGEGTYSYAFLNANYDSIFIDGGSGSITVGAVIPEPATGALLLAGMALLLRRKRA